MAAGRPPYQAAQRRSSLMRLHYLSYARLGSGAANVIQILKMCEAFAQGGHDVTLFTAGQGDSDEHLRNIVDSENWHIVHPPALLRRVPPILALPAFVAYKARSCRPDLYYGRHLASLVAVASGRVPMVYESHGPVGSAVYRYLEASLFRTPSFVQLVVITDALRAYYLRTYGPVLDGKVTVAPDAASPCPDPPPQREKESDRPVIGYAGSLYEGRGIELMCALAEALPGYQFDIAGGSPEEVRFWQGRASARNVRYLGRIPHRELCCFMQSCDVLVAPYQPGLKVASGGEGTDQWMSPLKVFEYMASGTPMVCSDFPVLREVLEDGRNALLRQPGQVGDWIDAVRLLVEDVALRRRIGNTALEDFRKRYTWAARAERVLACAKS
jgi:glycosyltransferase involved in cell wall biosynthesis